MSAKLKLKKLKREMEFVRSNCEQRWRKFPDEKPSEEGNYIICGSSGFRSCDKWTYCQDRKRMDFSFYTHGVEYWMPMPPAPPRRRTTNEP